jgi:catechol 2,3-dioxygenase-like lactoylglutathione lyase family enzyme
MAMKFVLPLIAVKDIEIAKAFYQAVLHQNVTLDLGGNVALEGLALQVDYPGLVGISDLPITYKPNDHELYFEEENFDGFIAHLTQFADIEYLHRAKEYPWGQRVVRFYDPDGHIIEVGESMESVFKRFQREGLSAQQIAERTMHPVDFVRKFIQ